MVNSKVDLKNNVNCSLASSLLCIFQVDEIDQRSFYAAYVWN